MKEYVFYCKLMNNLMNVVVIFTLYLDSENTYFYWDAGEWRGRLIQIVFHKFILCLNALTLPTTKQR